MLTDIENRKTRKPNFRVSVNNSWLGRRDSTIFAHSAKFALLGQIARSAKQGKLELPQAILAPLMPPGIRVFESLLLA